MSEEKKNKILKKKMSASVEMYIARERKWKFEKAMKKGGVYEKMASGLQRCDVLRNGKGKERKRTWCQAIQVFTLP